MVLRLIRNQSTSETKLGDIALTDNRRTALFNIFGNYFSVRKNARRLYGVFFVDHVNKSVII